MLKWLLTWHVLYTVNIIFLRLYCEYTYRKPPTISPGLIYFRKRFLMGLYKGELIYGGGGLIHGRSFVLVINKSDHVRHKQVSHKQENKHVLRLLHTMNVRFSLLDIAQRILGITLPNFQ